jgi:hypothetical protein
MYAPGGIPDLSQLNLSCFSIDVLYSQSLEEEVKEGEERAQAAYEKRLGICEKAKADLVEWKNRNRDQLNKHTNRADKLRGTVENLKTLLNSPDVPENEEVQQAKKALQTAETELSFVTEELKKYAMEVKNMQGSIDRMESGLARQLAAIERRKKDTSVVTKWLELNYTSYPLWETPEQDPAAAASSSAAKPGEVPLLWIDLPKAWEEGMPHSNTVDLKDYLQLKTGKSGTKWGPNKWMLPMSFAYAIDSGNMDEQENKINETCGVYLNDTNQSGPSGKKVEGIIAKWTAENDFVDQEKGYWSAPHMMMDYYMLKNVGLHTLGNAHMHVEQNFKWGHEYVDGSKEMWEDISCLYNLCLRAPRTPIPILVVRTIRHEHRSPTEWFKKLTKNPMRSGDSILTPTFLSTALVDLSTSWYSHGPGSFQEDPYPERPTGDPCCSIQIAIPRGFPILYLADAVGNEHKHEKEVLLPPGIQLVYCGKDSWEEEPSHEENRDVMNFSAIFPDSVLNSHLDNEQMERRLKEQVVEEKESNERERANTFGP